MSDNQTRSPLPDVQYTIRPGIVELRSGHPDLALLPTQGLMEATRVVLEREPKTALSYGAEQGPGCLIEALRLWLGRMEGRRPKPEQIMITGGASQALDMLCLLLTQPGDVALVQEPTYHLARRVMQDHQLKLLPVSCDNGGIQVDLLEQRINRLLHQGKHIKVLYLVSTFNNPSGISLSDRRRKAITTLARKHGFLVIEDDVYHQLWYDLPPPPSMFHQAQTGTVIRLGSFSKIMAPGLRLGWIIAPSDIVDRCTKSGVLDSGGGLGHFNAHVMAAFIELKHLDTHVAALRSNYRKRRDTLVRALEKHLPEGCQWITPGGGFFLWLKLPENLQSASFLPIAESCGVSYLPGNLFFLDNAKTPYCRLNYTMVSLEELQSGARRLGQAIKECI